MNAGSYAARDFKQGTVPTVPFGTMGSVPTVPFGTMGTVPTVEQLNGGSVSTQKSKATQKPIVHAYRIKESANGTHKYLREARPLFVQRMINTDPSDRRRTVLPLHHLNYVMRTLWHNYQQTLGASPAASASALEDNNFYFNNSSYQQVASVDQSPLVPGGERARPPDRRAAANDSSLNVALLREQATPAPETGQGMLARRGYDGFYVPSVRRMWKLTGTTRQIPVVNPFLAPPDRRGPLPHGPSGDGEGDGALALTLLEEQQQMGGGGGAGAGAGTMQEIRKTLEEQMQRELAQEEVTRIYKAYMHANGRYASMYELRDKWNFLGVCRNTSWQRDTTGQQQSGQVPYPTVNTTHWGPARIENYWGNDLTAGMELYLIWRRHRESDGRYSYMELVPWHGPGRHRPGISERAYLDLSGHVRLGDLIHVGTVKDDALSENSVPDGNRLAALNRLPQMLSLEESDNYAAQLDTVNLVVASY